MRGVIFGLIFAVLCYAVLAIMLFLCSCSPVPKHCHIDNTDKKELAELLKTL